MQPSGEFYEQVEINNNGRQEQSGGTDSFIAEFDRLMRKCVGATEMGIEPPARDDFGQELRDCFELLLALLRHIDEGNDDVFYFADDVSSHDVGVE